MGRKQKSESEKIKCFIVGLMPKHAEFVKNNDVNLSKFVRFLLDKYMKEFSIVDDSFRKHKKEEIKKECDVLDDAKKENPEPQVV